MSIAEFFNWGRRSKCWPWAHQWDLKRISPTYAYLRCVRCLTPKNRQEHGS